MSNSKYSIISHQVAEFYNIKVDKIDDMYNDHARNIFNNPKHRKDDNDSLRLQSMKNYVKKNLLELISSCSTTTGKTKKEIISLFDFKNLESSIHQELERMKKIYNEINSLNNELGKYIIDNKLFGINKEASCFHEYRDTENYKEYLNDYKQTKHPNNSNIDNIDKSIVDSFTNRYADYIKQLKIILKKIDLNKHIIKSGNAQLVAYNILNYDTTITNLTSFAGHIDNLLQGVPLIIKDISIFDTDI